jgi:hypothetical protein
MFDNADRSYMDKINHTDSQITQYWRDELEKVEKAAALALFPLLDTSNALGATNAANDIKSGSLQDGMIQNKRNHPNQIILTRVGDFYETCGVDAIMLVEYAGERCIWSC